jgi:hypothetical protein
MQTTAAVHDCAGRRLGVAVAGRSGVRIITKIGAGVCVARRAIALEISCNSFCIAREGTSAIEGMCR